MDLDSIPEDSLARHPAARAPWLPGSPETYASCPGCGAPLRLGPAGPAIAVVVGVEMADPQGLGLLVGEPHLCAPPVPDREHGADLLLAAEAVGADPQSLLGRVGLAGAAIPVAAALPGDDLPALPLQVLVLAG
jgi:hypothetical protein